MPRVSVIIPTYQAGAELDAAVASALAQTTQDIEVLVVDDGSTVNVASRLMNIGDERLAVITHPRNCGVSAARNTALAKASAPIVALLDSDDVWCETHLAASLAVMTARDCTLVYGNAVLLEHPYGRRHWFEDAELAEQPVQTVRALARGNTIVTSTVVAKTDAVRSAGGWPAWLRVGEDWWLYFQLLASGATFGVQPEPLTRYQWPTSARHATAHGGQVMRDRLKMARALRRSHGLMELPCGALFVEPVVRYVVGWLPWGVRRRLRAAVATMGQARRRYAR